MIRLLIKAANQIDNIFWKQAYGDKDKLLRDISDSLKRRLVQINYGPYDRLDGYAPLLPALPPRPPGANFYPSNFSSTSFEKLNLQEKTSAYTMLARNKKGEVVIQHYRDIYQQELRLAAQYMEEASRLATDENFKEYLKLRAQDLRSDRFGFGDLAWLKVTNSPVDFIVGPIETYEDALMGYKSAYQACLMLKEPQWTEKIQPLTTVLPRLKSALPYSEHFSATDSLPPDKLGVYDAIYMAGLFNTGSKSVGLNAPRLSYPDKSKRRLVLRNIIEAKFEKVLAPLAAILIDSTQRKYIDQEAFFYLVLFHELAHGMEIAKTRDGVSVQQALRQYASTLEEGKGDIMGLFMITKLHEQGGFSDISLEKHYITFLASVLRSVRFGTSSDHAKANMMRIYYLMEKEAVTYNSQSGTFRINLEKMPDAIYSLTEKILRIQYEGDQQTAMVWIRQDGRLKEPLISALKRVRDIPIDLVFDQGDF